MNPATPEPTSSPELTPEQIAIEKKFADQENRFSTTETTIALLREFFKKHRDLLAPFDWTCYGWGDPDMSFSVSDRQQAKDIAAAFGKGGWTRERDPYTCGYINWIKEFDGVEITIKGAEVAPKLIEEVKL